jgi:hypothetical protein
MSAFDEKSAAEAAESLGFSKVEWITNASGISLPSVNTRNKESFIEGARYQHLANQEELRKKDEQIAELKKFKEDAIAMAADFYLNPVKNR